MSDIVIVLTTDEELKAKLQRKCSEYAERIAFTAPEARPGKVRSNS